MFRVYLMNSPFSPDLLLSLVPAKDETEAVKKVRKFRLLPDAARLYAKKA